MSRLRFPRSSDLARCLVAAATALAVAAAAGTAAAHTSTVRDTVAGVAIELPDGWERATHEAAVPGRSVDRLTIGTRLRPAPRALGGCRRASWLRRNVASEGAAVWVRERLLPTRAHLRSLPRRPTGFALVDREGGGCFRGGYRWRFRTGGRSITVAAFLAPDSDPALRRDVVAAIESLEIEATSVGRSREGRSIELWAAGDPAGAARVLVVGCIHGDECASTAVLRRLARRPARGIDLWLIPTLNPDGRAAGTRQNAGGVDLNRNFPGTWEPRGAPGDRYYQGPRPGSEPETRTAMRVITRLRPDVTIWFHQPEVNVRAGGGSAAAARVYAELVGLPYLPLPVPAGAATAWQTSTYPGSQSFVVELPPGPMDAASARLHTRAVRTLATRLRPQDAGG